MGKIEKAKVSISFRDLLYPGMTHMNGKMRIQMTEKIAWKSEGNLHAQVEFGQLDVPSVIPAAINAPILHVDSINQQKTIKASSSD